MCSVVIVEGDLHPGATRGRMSFLCFNPSIDKLNEETSTPSETESAATSSGRQNESLRENGSPQGRSEDLGLESRSSDSNGNHKRKQHDAGAEAKTPNKSRKSNQDNQDSNSARSRSSQKLNKREKLDWNVLRSPNHHSKKSKCCERYLELRR
ncbi:uncharacterized protein LOC125221096 [Salvia hispanica]|uniref:uncharacterized protein LOC125221096 n=1 Tax=Salvia hispanica TaxID=49212 RepID=UPI0020096CE3|nr:uncharacterized protein LOC125221096 [Salvia hispanica]